MVWWGHTAFHENCAVLHDLWCRILQLGYDGRSASQRLIFLCFLCYNVHLHCYKKQVSLAWSIGCLLLLLPCCCNLDQLSVPVHEVGRARYHNLKSSWFCVCFVCVYRIPGGTRGFLLCESYYHIFSYSWEGCNLMGNAEKKIREGMNVCWQHHCTCASFFSVVKSTCKAKPNVWLFAVSFVLFITAIVFNCCLL